MYDFDNVDDKMRLQMMAEFHLAGSILVMVCWSHQLGLCGPNHSKSKCTQHTDILYAEYEYNLLAMVCTHKNKANPLTQAQQKHVSDGIWQPNVPPVGCDWWGG